MILPVQRLVHDAIAGAIRQQYGLTDLPAFVVEVPPTRSLGDLAVPVAFQLARQLRKAPKAIAQEVAAAVGPVPGVARIVAAPNGYLNVYLERAAFLIARLRHDVMSLPASSGKTIVEHTAINPNKAAHIGHLRNAALGDTLARVLRFRGVPVEVQNYIDDLGVQVADIVVGLRELEQRSLDQVRDIADTTRFDYYCWDLYARVTDWYGNDPERLAVRAATLHDLEHGGNETAAAAAFIVDRIVRAHLKTMRRLGIGYDLLTHEGDILRLRFWAHAFEILKASGAVFLQTEGKLAGCWVMRIDEEAVQGCGGRAIGNRRRRGAGSARKGDRQIERRGDLRRQRPREPVLEVRPAGPGLQLPAVRIAGGRPAAVVDDLGSERPGGAAVREGDPNLQRHRLTPDVPAGASQPGAQSAGPCRAKRRTRFTSPTRWSRSRTRPPGSSAIHRRTARRPRSRSSRCRDARGSA